MREYAINEIFLTVQGEGVRAGTAAVFLRFAACNLTCSGTEVEGAFQPLCDTEFASFRKLTGEQILAEIRDVAHEVRWIVCTGGEPALQLDGPLVSLLRSAGFLLAIETNGTVNVDTLALDWVCVSPKVAEHALQQLTAHEVKYVRAVGHGIPRPRIRADHYVLSPAAQGPTLDPRTIQWCVDLVLAHPQWRLSVQQHKLWGVR